MPGGTLQLLTVGYQDECLIGNPKISFFRQVYRSHTNFAVQTFPIRMDGIHDFGRRLTCVLPRQGDLVNRLTLRFELPALSTSDEQWCDDIGLAMIEYVEMEVGGKVIDHHTGEWLYMRNQLHLPEGLKTTFQAMTRGFNENAGSTASDQTMRIVYVPLSFWFCESTMAALPLIALQFHDVKINLKLRSHEYLSKISKIVPTQTADVLNVQLLVDYVYLDEAERHYFSQKPHEILIENLQYHVSDYLEYPQVNHSIKLDFKHPVKEIVWAFRSVSNTLHGNDLADGHVNDWFNFLSIGGGTPLSLCKTASLQVNTHDRTFAMDAAYYSVLLPFYTHTSAPVSYAFGRYKDRGIYIYSFALRPEEQSQPSGSMNFSRIDRATLDVELQNTTEGVEVLIYAITYNIFRISGGMGAIAFY